jgi:hypothetical protein
MKGNNHPPERRGFLQARKRFGSQSKQYFWEDEYEGEAANSRPTGEDLIQI